MKRGLRLLLDTHIWYWYCGGSQQLPVSLRAAIDDVAGMCWLSPISVWEFGVLVRKGRIHLDTGFDEWVGDALEEFPLHEAPLDLGIARRAFDLELPNNDPGDQLLAVTALVCNLTLVTVDRELLAASWLPCLEP